MIDVNVKFSGGKKFAVTVKNSATVGDVLTKAGINPESYSITVNGKPANTDTSELATASGGGKLITLAEAVKGGC